MVGVAERQGTGLWNQLFVGSIPTVHPKFFMNEFIYFINNKTREEVFLKSLVPWTVPRQGEEIEVRTVSDGQDFAVSGRVDKVTWYYSSGNQTPVAKVYIDPWEG